MTGPDTTPRPAGGHLSLETLADRQEGLLDPAREREVAEHLAGCGRCAAEHDELARVPRMLAAAREVGPTPVEVVTQLDAALAAEQLGAAATASTTVTPLRTSSMTKTPLGTRVLQAAAVVVLLLAGLGVAISAIGTGGGSDTSADSSAGRAAAEAAGGGAGFPLTASGRNWNADLVRADAPELLTGELAPPVDANLFSDGTSTREDGSSPSAAPEAADKEAARLAGGAPLADCVAGLAGGPVTPLAVDIATWQSEPAAVILLPAPGDRTSMDVWVVAPDCSSADAKLLYWANLPRP